MDGGIKRMEKDEWIKKMGKKGRQKEKIKKAE